MQPFIEDEKINEELTKLIALFEKSAMIQRYKDLEKKIEDNQKLSVLVEKIKEKQKEAVQYAHYDKPEAERQAIQQADELKEEFDNHPLVIAYRKQLIEVNDWLQYITDKIQYRVNEELERNDEKDATKDEKYANDGPISDN